MWKLLAFSTLLVCLNLDVTAQNQSKPHYLNPYLNYPQVHQLKKYNIDLSSHQILDANFQKNVQNALVFKKKENQKRAQVAAFGAIGIMGLATGLSNIQSSFSSQSTNSILSAIGAISIGISFKKLMERKSATKKFEEEIRLAKAQYDLLK